MRKVLGVLIVIALIITLFPARSLAASASFSISGPSTLGTNETGTYTVKVSVSDAAAAQATLNYDSSFFELVSGNTTGVWDVAENTSTTVTLITVTLKCIAGTGTSGSLSLSNYKASRLTGTIPPSESVSCSGASKTVTNPEPEPTPTPTVAPTATSTTAPTTTATIRPSATTTPKPSATPTASVTATPSLEPSETLNATAAVEATPSPTPEKPLEWPDVEDMVAEMSTGSVLSVNMQGKTEMPVSVLAQLKESEGILEIDFGDYTCTIDSSTLNNLPDDFETLDLAVSMVKDSLLSQEAGGFDIYQLHFNYHGELPGIFTYTFYASENQPGDILYLYYSYEQAGVIEGMQSAVVDEDGYVSFEIYHCSSYFVSDTIVEDAMNNFTKDTPIEVSNEPVAPSGIPVWILIICVLCTAVLSIVGTMYFCKAGFSKKKQTDYLR